jgi:hypothetical protein
MAILLSFMAFLHRSKWFFCRHKHSI